MFRLIISYVITLALIVSPLAAYPSPQEANNQDRQENLDEEFRAAVLRLDEYMKLVTQLRTSIDRSQFETEALIDKLDYDADKIIQFVTENIYFEQYSGLLRGAQGTLMSRAGNALDQSVLLATLLNDAGFDSRIVRGELKSSQIKILLQQMGKERSRLPLGDINEHKRILTEMAELAKMPNDQVAFFVESSLQDIKFEDFIEFQDAVQSRNFILEQLKLAGENFQPLNITENLYTEAQNYFWIEYKAGDADTWKSVHPAFSTSNVNLGNLSRTGVIKGSIPPDLQHRFRFQVFLEQKLGNKLNTRSLVGPWERPSVNLLGKSLNYSNIPDGFRSHDDISQLLQVAKNTHFLIPMFTVDQSATAQSDFFDMNGISVDREAAANMAAALFQTLGDKLGNSLQSLTAMESNTDSDKDNFQALSALWIEFTQIAPGGKEHKVKRYVIDRIGAENRKLGKYEISYYKNREQAILKLASTHKFALSTGSYPESYMFDQYLSRMLSAKPLLVLSLEQSFYPSRPLQFKVKDLTEVKDSPELMVAGAFNRLSQTEKTSIHYHHMPSLVILKNEFSYKNNDITIKSIVDILANNLRVLKNEGDRFLFEPYNNILAGAWTTRLEEINYAGADSAHLTRWNTRKAFALAAEKKVPVWLLKSGETARVGQISGIKTETRQAILRDLTNGYHVIVPSMALDDSQQIGWWRVESQTGETLGMINEGLGSEVTEYGTLVTLLSVVMSVVLAYPGYVDCMNKKQKNGKQCSKTGCVSAAGLGISVGILFGLAVGYLAGALVTTKIATGAIKVALDVSASGAKEASKGVAMAIEVGVARGMDLGNVTKVLPQLPSCMD